jgi:hypothetical protein
MNSLKNQIFVAVSAAVAQRWPIQTNSDHKLVASTAVKLTDILYDEYTKLNVSEEKTKNLLTES